MNIVVFTSDDHNWCLKPFSVLFNKYWSEFQHVDIAGYSVPEFDLPRNFKFHSIAKPQYNKARWAEGVKRFLSKMDFEYAIIMLEDYWITRKVDTEDIQSLWNFCVSMGDNVLRVDLTADRLYAGGVKDCGYWEKFDIIQAKGSQYEMSMQAGIWNIRRMIDVLDKLDKSNRSAWDVEIYGTSIVNDLGFDVYGTRQLPLRYANALNNALGQKVLLGGISIEDVHTIENLIPEEKK